MKEGQDTNVIIKKLFKGLLLLENQAPSDIRWDPAICPYLKSHVGVQEGKEHYPSILEDWKAIHEARLHLSLVEIAIALLTTVPHSPSQTGGPPEHLS